ncbi:GNAT family N-acetyltransferase [Ferrimicrobium sp.]|uniref:GNAT family N-acetyltransferase n=1 Tax=Ferrimicrobium sp. TaxID=2926050 RepID=UPI002601CA25|nr:GNAT family N-acetyltransferase [Ferrimicrobium sp.]
MTRLIVPRSQDHLPQCVEALSVVHAAVGYPVVWPTDPSEWLTGEGFLGAWVATDETVVQGHIGLKRSLLDDGSSVGEIFRLFVVPDAQGTGIGRSLLALGVARSHAHGLLPMLRVLLPESRDVASWYERLGWRLHSTRLATHGPLASRGYSIATYLLRDSGSTGGDGSG